MDWTEIAFIVCLVLLVISGGFLVKLWQAFTTFVNTVNESLKDGTIDEEEWTRIIDSGKNVVKAASEIVKLVATKRT